MIPREHWVWHGMVGHLIVGHRCCFHLVTDIGEVRVSTVGCYHRRGEPKTYDTRDQIGSGRLYETMVFRLSGPPLDERSAQDDYDPSNIDSDGYNDEAEAEAGHAAMCEKWAELDGDPARADL